MLVGFVVVLLVGGVYAYSRFKTTVGDIYQPRPVGQGEQQKPNPDIVKEPFNILLIGYDYRADNPDEGARSDTLILVHVDPVNKFASMLSIPRDSHAYIPYKDQSEKINAAYSYGFAHPEIFGPNTDPRAAGAEVAIKAVEEFLSLEDHGVQIDHHLQVDFNGFKQIVDTIGGINVDVPQALLDPEYPSDDGDNGFIRLYIPAGRQHMDGTTALRYARSRHSDSRSDFGRADRQQQVIRAILASVKERGLIDQILTGDQIAQDLRTSVLTSLPIDDLTSLKALASLADVLSGNRIASYSIAPETVRLEQDPVTYSIYWNKDDVSAVVEQWLSGPPQPESDPVSENSGETPNSDVRVQVLNGASVPGLAGDVTGYLESQGFGMLGAGTADQRYDNTLLIDYTGQKQARDRLAQLLGIKKKYVVVQPEVGPPNPDGADILLILGSDYREEWRGAGGN